MPAHAWRGLSGKMLLPAARVRLVVCRLERLDIAMRIYLRGTQRVVTEELLYCAKVGAAVEQMRGEGVAQNVGRRLALNANTLKHSANDALDGATT